MNSYPEPDHAHRHLAGMNGTAQSAARDTGRVPVGEVIEASTTDLLAQACELDGAPPFGAFVRVATDDGLAGLAGLAGLDVYGVVAHVETGGIDPGARAIMRGHDDVRDDRIYLENPDPPLVLRTTFRAVVVGFAAAGQIYQFLPPRPPRLHYSVFVCPPAMVRSFTSSGLDYLRALLAAPGVPADELVAANLRQVALQRDDAEQFLQASGRELAQLLRADYSRLTAILRRCVA
jgi:hypothetical protein